MKSLGRAILLVALLGLSTQAMAADNSDASVAGSMSGLQLALGDCLVAHPPAPPPAPSGKEKALFDAVAGAVITAGVNYLGKALTAAGTAKTWTVIGSRNLQTTTETFPKCILVVRGSFVTAGAPAGAWAVPSGWPSTLSRDLGARGIWLSDAPEFIFEGEFVSSKDQMSMTIRPVIASYSKPIGTRFFRWGSERDVALFFSITTPGTKATVDTNPAATVVLGKLVPSVRYLYEDSQTYSSPYESSWFSISKIDVIKPLTVTAMLSETQDDEEFFTFLGTVFSDPKVTAAADTQLSQVLIPSVRKQTAADDSAKSVTAANDADTKFGVVIAKLNACKGATDTSSIAGAGADARSALRNFMIADGLSPTPAGLVTQSTVEQIDLTQQSSAIKAACTKILSSITKS